MEPTRDVPTKAANRDGRARAMRPVMQTKFLVTDDDGENVQRGNCLQACLASIFELDLDDVPHFVAMPENEWWAALWNWLGERNIEVHYERITAPGGWLPLSIPYLLAGPSPRGEFSHVVVAQSHEVIHDPHPDGTGLAEGWRGAYYFLVRDPARQPFVSEEASDAA
jgi:hypothetical protein